MDILKLPFSQSYLIKFCGGVDFKRNIFGCYVFCLSKKLNIFHTLTKLTNCVYGLCKLFIYF